MLSSRLVVRAVAIVAAVSSLLLASSVPALAENACPQPANQPAADYTGPEVKPKVHIKPETTAEVLNFDGERGIKSFDVVLIASHAVPRTIKGANFEIDVPRRLKRVSDSLETTTLRLPSFSKPQFIEHRQKIRFRACFDTTDAPAGIYTGQIIVSGPPGFSPSTITSVTVNAKAGSAFWLSLGLALLLAFALLLLRAAKEEREKNEEKTSWRQAARTNLKNPLFVVSTIVALATAFVAMRAIYDADPAWGADPWASLFAICGAGFSAAGIGSLISTFSPSKKDAGDATK